VAFRLDLIDADLIDDRCAAIELEAQSDAEFVPGSAVAHDYELVLGSHSVHTSTEALREAEARISAIQTRLIQQGRL